MKEKKSIQVEKYRYSIFEKGPVGSKVLERNVCLSNSEIKAEKEQPDRENPFVWINLSATPSHWKVSHVLVEWFCISPKRMMVRGWREPTQLRQISTDPINTNFNHTTCHSYFEGQGMIYEISCQEFGETTFFQLQYAETNF